MSDESMFDCIECGHLFVFRGRKGNLAASSGMMVRGCVFTKRLERGRFLWPSPADGVAASWSSA